MEEGLSVELRLSPDDAAAMLEEGLGTPAVRVRGMHDAITVTFDVLSTTASVVTLVVGARELPDVFRFLFKRNPGAQVELPPGGSDEQLGQVLHEVRELATRAHGDVLGPSADRNGN